MAEGPTRKCPHCGERYYTLHACRATRHARAEEEREKGWSYSPKEGAVTYGSIHPTSSPQPFLSLSDIMAELHSTREYLYNSMWTRCDDLQREIDHMGEKIGHLNQTLTELLEVLKGVICH